MIPNQIRGNGGRELCRFRGNSNAQDSPNGAEAWVGSVTKAIGATTRSPYLGCSEVMLPDGRQEYLFRLIEEHPEFMIGKGNIEIGGAQFGILVKILDARRQFLLQSHPTKETAERVYGSDRGKVEFWYILDVRKDAKEPPYIYLGFKPGISRESFVERFRNNDMNALQEMCHKIPVKSGEAYFIPGGMPHALGEGCMVIEVQEPCDITAVPASQDFVLNFRRQGNPQAVLEPIDEALYASQTIETFAYEGFTLKEILQNCRSDMRVLRSGDWGEERLVFGAEHSDLFSATIVKVDGAAELCQRESAQIAIVIQGSGMIGTNDAPTLIKQGDELFIPYGLRKVTIHGDVTLFLCNSASI